MIRRVDNWNGGELRRYHHASRAILVTHRHAITGKKSASIIPASCCHISVNVERSEAARILKEWRAAP